jgi:putative thioredoxin
VVLAKVDVDANPAISQAFQVQSIPAVYALKDGKVVDGFMGAYPEHVVQQFVDALMPSAEEQTVATLIAAGDEASLRQALELEPGNSQAVCALAELLVAEGASEEALQLLTRIPEDEHTVRIAAQARLAMKPADNYEAELDALLERVKADEDARQQFVDILAVMGPEDPRTARYRKLLSGRLY